MKLSEYIEKLQAIVDEVGDVDCVFHESGINLRNNVYNNFKEYAGDGSEHLTDKVCTTIVDGKKHYLDAERGNAIDCQEEIVFVANRKLRGKPKTNSVKNHIYIEESND